MKLQSAIQILKRHNEWRRGAEIDQADPKLIGMAIDTVVNYLEAPQRFNPKFERVIKDIESKINKR